MLGLLLVNLLELQSITLWVGNSKWKKKIILTEEELVEEKGGSIIGGLLLVGAGLSWMAKGVKAKSALQVAQGAFAATGGGITILQSFR